MKKNSYYHQRQQALIAQIKQHYQNRSGSIILFANFEREEQRFKQESSLYYFTGIEEPAVVFILDLTGKSTLYIPNYAENRAQWMAHAIEKSSEKAQHYGVDAIEYLGDRAHGYQFSPLFTVQEYATVLKLINNSIKNSELLFTPLSNHPLHYIEQRLILERLEHMAPGMAASIIDIAPEIAALRRKKSKAEIELLYKAIEVTMIAQEAAAQVITDGKKEREIQAGIEYVFTESATEIAFPSIIASGKNSTVLHYHSNKNSMKNGDLVIVDIGARYNYYCADITRTYPVSGKFTSRQLKLYEAVLATQDYIAQLAKPGMWLNNKEKPEQSLHHLAKKFLDTKSLGNYFIHGIGHFLGLDVHDVGNYADPLQENDVITIEPGIYIPEEKIGIRIEDNYWIIKNGSICMSDELPKDPESIEKMIQQNFSLDENEEESEEEFND